VIYLLMFGVGVVAGFMNTLAGGGSLLVLPILILAGLPSPVANATNRVAILLQNVTAVQRFHQAGKLEVKPILHITVSAVVGAILGSLFAVNINSALFDKILGFVFILILILVLRPKSKKPMKTLPRWLECVVFFGVGLYGGFIQAGVGFIFLAALNLIEHYNLVQANAVKTFIVMSYTIFAVIVFATAGKILWIHGLVLACGNSLGAWLGVRSAVKNGESFVKVILIIAVSIACLKFFGLFALIGL